MSETIIAYNSKCDTFIEKWTSCSIRNHMKNHASKCQAFAYKNAFENMLESFALLCRGNATNEWIIKIICNENEENHIYNLFIKNK